MLSTKIRSARLYLGESGSSLVEFALTSTILLMMIFGILDCSRAMYAYHFVANAAEEATRYAMVRGSSWNGVACSAPSTVSCTAKAADIQSFVTSITPGGITPGSLTVTPTWTGSTPSGVACSTSTDTGCVVSVQVSYAFNFIVPFLPSNGLVLRSTAAATIAQ